MYTIGTTAVRSGSTRHGELLSPAGRVPDSTGSPTSGWGGGPLAGLSRFQALDAVILAHTRLTLPIVIALTLPAVGRVPGNPLPSLGARRA